MIPTIREVRLIFGRNNFPNSSTVERIIEKFERTASVVDVIHTKRVRSDVQKQTHRGSSRKCG